MKGYKSVLIKDTTREEREEIVRRSISCESGCENCSGCALGVGDPFELPEGDAQHQDHQGEHGGKSAAEADAYFEIVDFHSIRSGSK